MACRHPIRAYKARASVPGGNRGVSFTISKGFKDLPIDLPCGQCIACRLERSRQWAIRCVHEAQLHTQNSFLTLTYSPDKVPKHNSLVKSHFQDFMKRYRFWLNEDFKQKIRFFHCGEYGEENLRPHYHALIFGHDFHDKELRFTKNGNRLYSSKKLEELWTHGYCLIGDITWESAAYVARYVTKKITGKNALHHYNQINTETGEVLSERTPEYVTMSRRPGIGKPWFDKFKTDVYPFDEVILRGQKLKPPKFYDKQLENSDQKLFEKIKMQRIAAGKKNPDNTWERRLVLEHIDFLKTKQLKRNL